MDIRQFSIAFIGYQKQQLGGLPGSKSELKECYSMFCDLQPLGTYSPSFGEVLATLQYIQVIRPLSEDSVITYNYNHKNKILSTVERGISGFYCDLCKCNCTSYDGYQLHLNGRRHAANSQVKDINATKEDKEKDKNDISITPHPVDFGEMRLGNRATKLLIISNSSKIPQTLVAYELVKKSNGLTISDPSKVCDGNTHIIPSGGSYQVSLECNAYNLGYIRDVLIFRFSQQSLSFHIFRYLTVHVADEDAHLLEPTSPFIPLPKKYIDTPPDNIVPGEPVPKGSSIGDYKPLPYFNIPTRLASMLNKREPPNIGTETQDYIHFFKHLLWFEETQMHIDIRKYDTWSYLTTDRHYLKLKVPGLAENRPSVLYGDSVFVSVSDGKEYEGVVHQVELEHVNLRFARQFHNLYDANTMYKIRFSFKRTPLRVMHQAVEATIKFNEQLLFPSDQGDNEAITTKVLALANTLRPINRNMNTQQSRAVAAILTGCAKPCPYVIFGPPVYLSDPKLRILACAPSNTAADLIAERLSNSVVQKRDLYRFNAYNRKNDLSPELLSVSTLEDNGKFKIPGKEYLNGKRVIVSTCVNASKISALSGDPFDYVFIDEAGQSTEPECISTFCITKNTAVVLAGDPQQLGPVIRSPNAKLDGRGLGRSMLERILQLPPYQRDTVAFSGFGNYDLRLITKLVNNYRSHPEVLSLPNELFYHNELTPMADKILRTSMCNWDGLPTKGFPIVFHGIEGKDQREGNSPSWFNADEASQVAEYIRQLLAYKATKVDLKDIGVISPYRKQVEKIRTLLENGKKKISTKGSALKVGSVEEFQGQERLVIIVSCVRSTADHVEFDLKHNLGFLKNPKRFNVAITRPKALLIVIGNPHVLVHDPHWAKLIFHCIDHGSYRGCTKPERSLDASVDKLSAVFSRLGVGAADTNGSGEISLVEGQEGPEWRHY